MADEHLFWITSRAAGILALLLSTAAVSAGDEAEPIRPSAIGCSMSNRSQIGVRIMKFAPSASGKMTARMTKPQTSYGAGRTGDCH